jgi:uncharacterized GH25 family protein
MIRFLLTCFLLLLVSSAIAGLIEGRVVQGDEPVAGIKVSAYRTLDFSEPAIAVSTPTDTEGLYRLELPAGRYALFAADPERQLFAFCGRNPVGVSAEQPIWAGLQAVTIAKPVVGPYNEQYSGAIEGRVLFSGKPLSGAYVYLYLGVEDDLKGQGHRMSLPTDAEGFFSFDGLTASNYFIVVRKRLDGGRVGPVLADDYMGVYPGNPLLLRSGQSLQLEIETVRKVKAEHDSETFTGLSGPTLRGVIVDEQGRPVAGMHVFAYTDRVIGHKRPAALSPPTSEDGRFELRLPDAGLYFIGARQLYGDSPAPNEMFGLYEESADHGLKVESGQEVEPFRIVVAPITLN